MSDDVAHRGQLLRCGGQGGLDRGDFTQSALLFRLLKAIDEVGVDLLQSRYLGWVHLE